MQQLAMGETAVAAFETSYEMVLRCFGDGNPWYHREGATIILFFGEGRGGGGCKFCDFYKSDCVDSFNEFVCAELVNGTGRSGVFERIPWSGYPSFGARVPLDGLNSTFWVQRVSLWCGLFSGEVAHVPRVVGL